MDKEKQFPVQFLSDLDFLLAWNETRYSVITVDVVINLLTCIESELMTT